MAQNRIIRTAPTLRNALFVPSMSLGLTWIVSVVHSVLSKTLVWKNRKNIICGRYFPMKVKVECHEGAENNPNGFKVSCVGWDALCNPPAEMA